MISVLEPDRLFLFQSMKRKQKSCQNEPSAGRFDGHRTVLFCFRDGVLTDFGMVCPVVPKLFR